VKIYKILTTILLLSILIIFSSCGGEPDTIKNQIPEQPKEINLAPDSSSRLNISIRPLKHSFGPHENLLFMITLTDKNEKPAYFKKSDIIARIDSQTCDLFPSVPATSPEVEEENQKKNNAGEKVYDHWIIRSGGLSYEGEYSLPVSIDIDGETYSGDYTIESKTKEESYYLPDASIYKSWVCDVYLSSNLLNQGGTLTVTAVPQDSYWASSFWLSASLSTQDIILDGNPVTGQYGHATLYGYWYWGIPQPVPVSPDYKVYVQGFQQHTITFQLDPAQSYLFEEGSVEGPWVIAGTGSWSTPEPFNVKPKPKNLTIENAKAEPPEFHRGESTEITANIVPNPITWAPTNLVYTVTIKDIMLEPVIEFTKHDTLEVNEVWDGKDSNGDYVGYGEYKVEIKVECDESVTATKTFEVKVVPVTPTVKRINFYLGSFRLTEDGKKKIKPIYDRDKEISNPICYSRDTQLIKRANVKFGIDSASDKTIEFDVWAQSPDGKIIMEKKRISFRPHSKISKGNKFKVLLNNMPIQKFDKFIWFCEPVGIEPLMTINIGETEFPFYVIFKSPIKPFKKEARLDILDYVMNMAENSATEEQARIKIVKWIYNEGGFKYDKNTASRFTGEWGVNNMTFYFQRIKDGYREGNCVDFSNLFQVCCASIGVKAMVRRISGPFAFRPILPIGWEFLYGWVGTADPWPAGKNIGKNMPFGFHQVGCFEKDKVYDPTLKVNKSASILPISMAIEPDYRVYVVDYNYQIAHLDICNWEWNPQKPVYVKKVK